MQAHKLKKNMYMQFHIDRIQTDTSALADTSSDHSELANVVIIIFLFRLAEEEGYYMWD